MIVINVLLVDGIIKPNTIYYTNSKLTQSITTGLKIPTGNYNDVLLNFDFISPKPKKGSHQFAVFKSVTSKKIKMEIGKFEYEGEIFENSCFIPHEVLNVEGKVELGIYTYKMNDEELEKRVSLVPIEFSVVKGSYDEEVGESVIPTPTEFEIHFDKVATMTRELEAFKTATENEINTLKTETENDLNTFKNETEAEMENYKWGVPAGSVIGYNGDEIPEGYEEVKKGYSLDEMLTGETWIDGKPIYKKTVNFGNLPNNASKSVKHNILNFERLVDISIIGDDNGMFFPIPFVPTNHMYSGISVSTRMEHTNIYIATSGDFSGKTAYVTVKYTKTTD